MTNPAQIVDSSNRRHSDNLIAQFKAKCGVSNRSIANLLNIDAKQAKLSLDNDMFTAEQNRLVHEVQIIIDHMIEESELLLDQSPYLVVLNHEKDMQELEIKRLCVANDKLKKEVADYENMGLYKRLLFLFNIRGN